MFTVALHRINEQTIVTEDLGRIADGRRLYRTLILGGPRGGEAVKHYDVKSAREHHTRVLGELMGKHECPKST